MRTEVRRAVGSALTLMFWAGVAFGVSHLPGGPLWMCGTAVVGLVSLYAAWTFSPWVPTSREARTRVIAHLSLDPSQTFVDLGSGDGALLLDVHRQTGARVEGVEMSPVLWLWGSVRLWWAGVDGRIRLGDLRAADLSHADAVYVWGSVHGLHAVAALPKRPCSTWVSRQYPIPGMHPHSVEETPSLPLYVYRVPP